MTTKKQQATKPTKPKRLYYRLDEAAKELTKHFGEEVTEDELIHWGAIGEAQILLKLPKDGFSHIGVITDRGALVDLELNNEWEFDNPDQKGKRVIASLASGKNYEDIAGIADDLAVSNLLISLNFDIHYSITAFAELGSRSLYSLEEQGEIQYLLFDKIITFDDFSLKGKLTNPIKRRWENRVQVRCGTLKTPCFKGNNLYLDVVEVERIKRGEERVFTQEEIEQKKQANKIFHQQQKAASLEQHSEPAATLSRLGHAKNTYPSWVAIERFWKENIDPNLSAQKAAEKILEAKIVDLSHKKIAEIVSKLKKGNTFIE